MRTRQGETICLGEWIRPASADFPPAGGVWGGMRAGFRTDFNFFSGMLSWLKNTKILVFLLLLDLFVCCILKLAIK